MATPPPKLPERVLEELQTHGLRVQGPVTAERLWNRHFTEEEQRRLGGNLEQAYRDGGTIGMWMRLHACSSIQAVIDLAKTLGFLDDSTARWLLRETGESSDDPEQMLQLALARAELVIVLSPRAIYWRGDKIPIDWTKRLALWNYFTTVAEQAKKGLPVDASDFGEHHQPNYHIKQKSRLSTTEVFPLELANKIVAGRGGQQSLELDPQQICILERTTIEQFGERSGYR